MPIATPSRKWSYAYHESHILTWRFTKRQVGMPYECWLLQAAGNCCRGASTIRVKFPGSCWIRSCTSSVRVNTRGLPGDRHKGKKAYTSESSWHPSGPLIRGDALDAGRADTHRLLRLPPRAASHPSVLTPPLAGATAAPDTARPLSRSRHALRWSV